MALVCLNRRPVWWRKRGFLAVLWLPIAGLFFALAALRRFAYRRGWLLSEALPVPVLVVGNIAVGGSGKTPVAIWLAQALRARGFTPGILSRGYGGTATVPTAVFLDSDPVLVGDEPVLLARRTGCVLWVGRDRVATGRALLAAHPEVNVLITDDGLQHYRLQRTAEIVVLDEVILGNCWPLPAGPLRESISRLSSARLLICNGSLGEGVRRRLPPVPQVSMSLEACLFYRLSDPAEKRRAADFFGQPLCAAAGIANPGRFFETLRGLGLTLVRTRAFADHHVFSATDFALAEDEVLLLTEKDAVKCAAFAPRETWVLPVEARIDELALETLLECLHGSETA